MRIDEDFLKYLESRKPGPSKVIRDKNYLEISVTNFVNYNQIKLKVKAHYGKWLEWAEIYLTQGTIGLETIRPCVSRPPKKILCALEAYTEEVPEQFAGEFYFLYIWEANLINPLNPLTRKPRGGSPHAISRQEMFMKKASASELYVCLSHWLKQPKEVWPLEITDLEISSRDPKKATMEVIKRHFDLHFGEMDPITFYNKYIVWRPLGRIKKHCQWFQYIPQLPYLSKVSKRLR